MGNLGGRAGNEEPSEATSRCHLRIEFVEQLAKGGVVAKGCHVWIRDEPAVVSMVLVVCTRRIAKSIIYRGGQSDEIVTAKAGAIAEFVQHASPFFHVTPSDGKQPQGNLDNSNRTFRIQLQNAPPFPLGGGEISAEKAIFPNVQPLKGLVGSTVSICFTVCRAVSKSPNADKYVALER